MTPRADEPVPPTTVADPVEPVLVLLPSLDPPRGVCTGCLGRGECWICDGRGCHRCDASGTCHLCLGTGRDPSAATPAQRAAPRERGSRR